MQVCQEIDIEKIFSGEENLKDFNKFLKSYEIGENLEDVTLKHTKKQLETLVALADEGKDSKLSAKKDILKKTLNNLKGQKDKKLAMKSLREIYSQENMCEDMDIKELNNKIKYSLREYKKYEHFKKHEQKIADQWIKELSKNGNKIQK